MTFRGPSCPERFLALIVSVVATGSVLAFVRGRVGDAPVECLLLLAAAASAGVAIVWVRDLLRWRTRARHLDVLLAEQLHRVDYHSRRLESLWKLATKPARDDGAFLQALLLESSGSIHPGPHFYGVISHLDGADVVIDVNQQCDDVDGALARGARLPFASTLLSGLAGIGTTRSWADVHADAAIAGIPRVASMPWHAFIGTSFQVGPTVYFLTFTSESALVEPFAPDDHAYLEIVASFCESRLQQRVQFDRLRHQASHDALTGLPNRTAFRVAGRQAFASNSELALAVVDIDGFRQLNEAIGHQDADAVLVEVAAAVAGRVAPGDVVARIGGDSFGVLLRDVESRAHAESRVECIRAGFRTAFGTGDRDGTARIDVAASIGIAVAPRDGSTFERLLARADSAVHAAKENRCASSSKDERPLAC